MMHRVTLAQQAGMPVGRLASLVEKPSTRARLSVPLKTTLGPFDSGLDLDLILFCILIVHPSDPPLPPPPSQEPPRLSDL